MILKYRFNVLLNVMMLMVFLFTRTHAQTSQIVTAGNPTTPVNFPGTGCIYNWTNSNPAIGLPASGTGNIPAFTAVNTTASTITATIKVTPVSGNYAYIPNASSGTISVIDITTNTVIKTIPVGITPLGVAASPDGTKMYITNQASQTISVINTASNTVIATISLPPGSWPSGIVITPDGSKIYTANHDNNTVSVIDTKTNAVINTIGVGMYPYGIAISKDGSKVYITNSGDNTVSVITTATNIVTNLIPVGATPNGIIISPDGSRLYVSAYGSNAVYVIDTATEQVTDAIGTGTAPFDEATTLDGSLLYVANLNSNNITVINTLTDAVVSTISIGSEPGGVGLNADGSRLYVTEIGKADVLVINTSNNQIVGTINVGTAPMPQGNFILGGIGCSAPSTFTITVNPSTVSPSITASTATGYISACAGSPSVNPNIQQITVSGSDLTGNITATAPTGFQISLSSGSGYNSSVVLTPSSGKINNTIIYVRSSSSAQAGIIPGDITFTSPGASDEKVSVKASIDAVPVVQAGATQSFNNGSTTTEVHFEGTGNLYTWTNDNPGIGVVASGKGNIPTFTYVNNTGSPVTANITAVPLAASYAYVANKLSNSVSVIDMAMNNSIVATIPVGKTPIAVALSPDGSRAYVANYDDNTVSVINTTTQGVVATVPAGNLPRSIIVSADGSKLYVANSSPNTISIINTASNTSGGTIPLTGTDPPWDIALSPDGSHLYVSLFNSTAISVINTATKALITNVEVGLDPSGISISPDGSRVYVANSNASSVSVINTANNTVIATVGVGTSPLGTSISADGSRLYVANSNSNSVSIINTVNNTLIATVPVGNYPDGISASDDGSQVYVANANSNSVTVISTLTNTATAVIPVGLNPISFGKFISPAMRCPGQPVILTLTFKPAALSPVITAGTVTGIIKACAGTASANPNIQQFIVSGTGLTDDIIIKAPAGFEVSANAAGGYGNSLSFPQTAGSISSKTVYVRSASSAPAGSLSGNIILSSTGATDKPVAVAGVVYALPTVAAITGQIVKNGDNTTAVNFTGPYGVFTWTNNTPGIGLPASGNGDIAAFKAINTTNTPVTATITVTPQPAGFAYVANSGDNTISVINTVTHKIAATIPVGSDPFGIVVSADGSRVYVTNHSGNTISVIDAQTRAVTSTITVGNNPLAIVMSHDGKTLYVTYGEDDTIISMINTVDNSVTNIPSVFYNYGIAISPDDALIYVVNENSGTVSSMDAKTGAVAKSVYCGVGSYAVTVSPDGSRLYVTNSGSNTVSVVNASALSIIKTITVGTYPGGIIITPDGGRLYVSNLNSNNVSVINTATNAVTGTINAGTAPFGISISPDGAQIYVANNGSNNVSVINAANNSVTTTVPIGSNPEAFGSFISADSGCSGIPVKFTITVNPPDLTITAAGDLSALNTIYGTPSASESFTVSATDMLAGILVTPPPGFEVSTDDKTFSNTVTVGSAGNVTAVPVYIRIAATTPFGTYSGNIVLSSTGAGSANEPMPESAVSRALLTVTADDKTKLLGNPNPIFTSSYSGFVLGEKQDVLTTLPSYLTDATTNSPIGQYAVTPYGETAANYTFLNVPGVLTIRAAPQTIVIPNAFTPNGDGVNDVWNIKALVDYPQCLVSIYTRYGGLVFQSRGYPVPWDGSSHGVQVPTGTYYYIVDPQDGTPVLSGYVAIIR